MKGIGGILGGIWALRPDLNLLRRNKENYGEVEGDHRLEIIRGGVEELRHWILPYMLDASLNVASLNLELQGIFQLESFGKAVHCVL